MPTACEPCPGKTNALVTNDPLYTNGWARWVLVPLGQAKCATSVGGPSQSISLQLYCSSIARSVRAANSVTVAELAALTRVLRRKGTTESYSSSPDLVTFLPL